MAQRNVVLACQLLCITTTGKPLQVASKEPLTLIRGTQPHRVVVPTPKPQFQMFIKQTLDKLRTDLDQTNFRSCVAAEAAAAALLAEEEADAARKAQQQAQQEAKAAAKRAKKQRSLFGITEDTISCPITQEVMRDPRDVPRRPHVRAQRHYSLVECA
ncbi:hypothetical protein WJX72_002403 [[Myrmecia] bisecta]|uniref:Uncharacterized protein n=1 Tax=[Myrmecia] bisecta TaxID=41462 RepID=A0AAW1R5W9_9CHLO